MALGSPLLLLEPPEEENKLMRYVARIEAFHETINPLFHEIFPQRKHNRANFHIAQSVDNCPSSMK